LRKDQRFRVIDEKGAEGFWYNRGEIKGDWRTQHTKELHNLHTSTNTIQVIKTRPIPVAARSNVLVCGCSLAVVMGSNPIGGMYVCLL
jgi:hypothetical protein